MLDFILQKNTPGPEYHVTDKYKFKKVNLNCFNKLKIRALIGKLELVKGHLYKEENILTIMIINMMKNMTLQKFLKSGKRLKEEPFHLNQELNTTTEKMFLAQEDTNQQLNFQNQSPLLIF